MEADGLWKAAPMNPARLPTALGKRFAFPTAPTAPAAEKKRRSRDKTAPSHPALAVAKVFRCPRSKVLPISQVAHPEPDEGSLFGRRSRGSEAIAFADAR